MGKKNTSAITGLMHFFDFVLTREDYRKSKPNPDPFLTAIKINGLKQEQCIIVEDSERGWPLRKLLASDVLQKVVDGLIRNAIENTPDEGKIEINVRKRGKGIEFVVHDYGVGITEENQRRIFEGFFVARDTMAYSSKRPFDFNAGGKGADLLRMKIFSERYNFKIDMTSSRCKFINADVPPPK